MKDYIVTVMAQDRVGIVRDVTSALSGLDGNITHLSQTVMSGYFTLIIRVEAPPERSQLEIRQAVERNGAVGEFEVNVRPYIEPPAHTIKPSQRFTLSLLGKDQPGIIAKATSYLADEGINVDDFYAYVSNGKIVMLVQVSIPEDANLEKIRTELEQLGNEYGLMVNLQHENIFKATSEVRPVMDLQKNRG